jgi:hypothetical protein
VGVGARNAHQVQRGLRPAPNKELALRVALGAGRVLAAGERAANIAEASLLVWVLQVARMLNQKTQQSIGINGTGTSLDDDAAELDLVAGVGLRSRIASVFLRCSRMRSCRVSCASRDGRAGC